MTVCYLAIDVGAEKLAAAIVGEHAEVLVRDRIATPQRDVWPALVRLAKRVLAAAPTQPVACGVGCVGPINPVDRTVSPLHIPSLEGFSLAGEIESNLGLPTVVDSSSKTIAMAESWCGAGVGLSDFIAVVMGPTVGGGIVSGGKLLEGRLGNAGNQVMARFVTRHYVGEYIRYHFETASGSELVVKNLNDSSAPQLSTQEEVALAWLPEDSQALDRSEVPTHN